MADKKKYDITSDGIERLREELDRRKGTERSAIAERIKVALSFGDLSENNEYDDAKEEQAVNEARIQELEDLIKNANVIEEHEISNSSIGLGAKVTLKEVNTGETETYRLVSSKEEDIFSNRISTDSPVGAALMNKHEGEIVTVSAPAGFIEYEIIKIG